MLYPLPVFATEHVHLPAHGERNPLRDTGSGEGPAAHSLGADGLRRAVHSITQVPHHHAHCAVSTSSCPAGHSPAQLILVILLQALPQQTSALSWLSEYLWLVFAAFGTRSERAPGNVAKSKWCPVFCGICQICSPALYCNLLVTFGGGISYWEKLFH